jgi:hypothetical protein
VRLAPQALRERQRCGDASTTHWPSKAAKLRAAILYSANSGASYFQFGELLTTIGLNQGRCADPLWQRYVSVSLT